MTCTTDDQFAKPEELCPLGGRSTMKKSSKVHLLIGKSDSRKYPFESSTVLTAFKKAGPARIFLGKLQELIKAKPADPGLRYSQSLKEKWKDLSILDGFLHCSLTHLILRSILDDLKIKYDIQMSQWNHAITLLFGHKVIDINIYKTFVIEEMVVRG